MVAGGTEGGSVVVNRVQSGGGVGRENVENYRSSNCH